MRHRCDRLDVHPLGRVLGSGAAITGKVFGVERVPVVKDQALPAYDPRAIQGIGVTYATTPETCAHIPEMLRAIVEGHDKCTVVRCGMTGFGASSLDFELQFDVHSPDYEYVFATRS